MTDPLILPLHPISQKDIELPGDGYWTNVVTLEKLINANSKSTNDLKVLLAHYIW